MKKGVLAAAALSVFVSAASAQEATLIHDISFNAAIVSDYRYRGISQTRLDPALQAGADYVHTPTGFYVGTWASTIKWINDTGGDSNVEADIYAGKQGELGFGDLGYDIGALRYIYPSDRLDVNANTTEVYAQLGFGPAYIKYSHALTNLFGFENSENSSYLDVGAEVELVHDYTLNLHVGRQRVKNNSDFSYTDWLVGVTKNYSLATVGLAAVGTNNDYYLGPGLQSKNLGKTGLVLSLSKTL